MNVLHLTSDWKWTGPAEPMLHAVTGLRARGHGADLACAFPPPDASGGGLVERARGRDVEPVARLAWVQGYRPLRDRRQVRELRRLIADARYDLVHVHHTRDLLLARAAIRGLPARARPRLVASWHRGEAPSRAPWTRWIWGGRAADGLTVLTSHLADAAVALGWSPERVAVVPGVVDSERFSPRPRRPDLHAELGLGGATCVVGVVARLQPHRRFDLLLDAIASVRRELPGLRVLVVGRGTRAREVLEVPVAARGLGDVVLRAGYRGGDFTDVLACMDALAFLVPGSDGSCRAVLEAMAMGIPVIATRRGTLPEIVCDGDTGQLIDETPSALADALRALARAPDLWGGRGGAGRKRVLERHQIPQLTRRLEQHYTSLLA